MKIKYIVFILLAIGIIVIHINSLVFPHSVLLRHIILFLFIGAAAYFAYESRRMHLEEYAKLKKFLKVCSFCKKVCITDPDTKEDKWIDFEEYMALETKLKPTQGKCPHCSDLIDKNRY